MARTISGDALAVVGTDLGAEPKNVLEIQWTVGGQRYKYGDKNEDDIGIKPRIQSLSNLDAIVQVSNGGDSASLDVVLSDLDGEIKTIMDANDIHMRPCWVYQWFEGLDYDDKFLIFKGQISSPLKWNEGDRTVSFTVISKIEDTEIGFSVEEGDINNPPEELIGKPWPLCFGTVLNIPCLRIKGLQEGFLQQGIGIRDPTLVYRLDIAKMLRCATNFEAYKIQYNESTVAGQFQLKPFFAEDPNCKNQRCQIIESLQLQYDEQAQFQFNSVVVYGGETFPQNTPITVDVNGGKFFGRMNGNVFTITGRRHPDVAANGVINQGDDQNAIESHCLSQFPGGVQPGMISAATLKRYFGDDAKINNIYDLDRIKPLLQYELTLADFFTPQAPTPEEVTSTAVASKVSFAIYNMIPSLDFFWAEAGSRVVLDTNKEIVFVANILPSTVLRVAAYRTLNAGRQLVTVPSDFYTVRETDFNTYQVVEIVMNQLLSTRKDEGWEDSIYVTLTSSVGPNVVDILRWIIETYTDFEIDDTTFDAVKILVDNYPANFPILDRPNVVKVLQDIAFQSRCALYLRDDVFYIKYLPAVPDVDDTIDMSDIEFQTLELTHTPTEDLVTKYVATWKLDYAVDEPNTVILRHNVKKYGTHEDERFFFIYNSIELVEKSATYWLIRLANTWRKVLCRTYFNKLKLETFDCAELTIPHLSGQTIKGIVEKADFDSETRRMDFEIWTPIKSGTTVPYDFAWPADIEEKTLWPTVAEREQGFAGSGRNPNFHVIAPANHPLSNPTGPNLSQQCENGQAIPAGAEISSFCRKDHGDSKPSDRGDVKPTPKIKTGVAVKLPLDKRARDIMENKFTAKSAYNEAKKGQTDAAKADENAGGTQTQDGQDGSDGDPSTPDPNDPDGPGGKKNKLPKTKGGNCTVQVLVNYVIPTLVTHRPGEDPVFDSTPGARGRIVASDPTRLETHTFNSMTLANAFKATMDAAIEAKIAGYSFVVGSETAVSTGLSGDLGIDGDETDADGEDNPNFEQPCPEPDTADQAQVGFVNESLS